MYKRKKSIRDNKKKLQSKVITRGDYRKSVMTMHFKEEKAYARRKFTSVNDLDRAWKFDGVPMIFIQIMRYYNVRGRTVTKRGGSINYTPQPNELPLCGPKPLHDTEYGIFIHEEKNSTTK